MSDMLIIDFETRGRRPLPECGEYEYAADPELAMLCLGYKLGDLEGVAYKWSELPEPVVAYITRGDGLVAAWNAAFDRQIWDALAPATLQLPMNRWYCLAAQARVNALPGSLADCTRALFGENLKDIRGPQLIKLLSIPQEDGTFLEDPDLLREMGEYCLKDVQESYHCMMSMRLMKPGEHEDWLEESYHCMMSMRMMTPREHEDWLDTLEVNDNGIRVDRQFAAAAIQYASVETEALAEELTRLTDGAVTRHTQVARVKDWILPRLPDTGMDLTTVYKKGEKKLSLDKTVRQRLLTAHEEGVFTLAPDVVEVLEIVDSANRSSVAKYQRMMQRSNEDGRVRGAFLYAGASQTLRFASRGLQLHNFTRDCLAPDDYAKLRKDVLAHREVENPLKTLSQALRPTLMPDDGNVFVVGDWSAIEACALPWLANDPSTDRRLAILADPDDDMYVTTALDMGFTKEDRQIGKVAELALGYAGGKGAFRSMAQIFGINVSEHGAQNIVDRWRAANPWALTFWTALERAAKQAVSRPGKTFKAGRIEYCFYPGLIDGTLVCTLPDGSIIQYPRAKLEEVETQRGPGVELTALKANWKPAAGEKEWPRVRLWRGLLAENVTQAFCAALLRAAVRELLENEWPVVAHVHDEIVLEVPVDEAEPAVFALKDIMEDDRSWAKGLPLIAEPVLMTRYGK